jgi:hypothetical protein
VQEHFLCHFPYMERIQGVLEEVPRGPAGPLGTLELAALLSTADCASWVFSIAAKQAGGENGGSAGSSRQLELPSHVRKVPYYMCSLIQPHTNLHINKSTEA